MRSHTLYFDHAATSCPKPDAVERAVVRCLREAGGNPGRGSHRLSLAAAEEVFRCREVAAKLFGTQPERVIFTLNATHAINLAIKGVLTQGGHALCSDLEHNAVLRPLYRLREEGVADFDIFPSFPFMNTGREEAILTSLATAVRPNTRMVICTHASNICSAHMPIARIGAFCRRRGILFVVDASQSAGAQEIDMECDGIDMLCMPGHKGLLGPQGTGFLLLGSRFADGMMLSTLIEGGNGVDSLSLRMSEDVPERYEAGTVATPSIAGLRAGLEFIRDQTPAAIGRREAMASAQLKDGLSHLTRIRLYAPHHEGAVVLFSVEGVDSEAVAKALDERGICVRPGFHCAALGHQTLGTPRGGAVRASVGYCTTERDVAGFLRGIRAVLGGG